MNIRRTQQDEHTGLRLRTALSNTAMESNAEHVCVFSCSSTDAYLDPTLIHINMIHINMI